MTVSGLLLDEQLHGMLTDEPLAVHQKAKGLADLRQRRVLHDDAELLPVEHHHLHEFSAEFLAEQQPERLGETLAENKHLVGIVEVKEVVVKHDHLCRIFFQPLDQSGFVLYIARIVLSHLVEQIHQSHAGDALRVSQYDFHYYSLRYLISFVLCLLSCAKVVIIIKNTKKSK